MLLPVIQLRICNDDQNLDIGSEVSSLYNASVGSLVAQARQ